MQQGADQFLALVLGLFVVAFGRKRLAATQAVHIVWEHHLVTGFFKQAAGFVQQRHLFLVTCRRAHDP